MSHNLRLKVTPHWGLKTGMILCVCFFLWGAFLARLNHASLFALIVFFAFAGSGLFCVLTLFRTAIIADHHGICQVELFKHTAVRWNDIQYVITDITPTGEIKPSITLVATQQQLPLLINYGGKRAHRLRHFIAEQLAVHHIPVVPLTSLLPWLAQTDDDTSENR